MIFFAILDLKNDSFHCFLSSDLDFFSNKVAFFHINLGLSLFFSVFLCCLYRPIAKCCITDFLQRVVLLSTVNFFMVLVLTVQMIKFNPT